MAKLKIKVKAFVSDLKSGVDDQTLMEKYNLNEQMLPKLLDQLVSAGHLSEDDLTNRKIFESTQNLVDLFSFTGPDDD